MDLHYRSDFIFYLSGFCLFFWQGQEYCLVLDINNDVMDHKCDYSLATIQIDQIQEVLIMNGLGMKLALGTMGRKEQLEAKRERWVEIQEIDGGFVEFMMVKCNCCSQPYPRQRVLRLGKKEMAEWQRIDRSYEYYSNQHNLSTGLVMIAGLLVGVAVAVFAAVAIKSVIGFLAGVIPCVIMYKFLCCSDRRRQEKLDEFTRERDCVLARHGNIPAKEVGTIDQWDKKYVILPKETS